MIIVASNKALFKGFRVWQINLFGYKFWQRYITEYVLEERKYLQKEVKLSFVGSADNKVLTWRKCEEGEHLISPSEEKKSSKENFIEEIIFHSFLLKKYFHYLKSKGFFFCSLSLVSHSKKWRSKRFGVLGENSFINFQKVWLEKILLNEKKISNLMYFFQKER